MKQAIIAAAVLVCTGAFAQTTSSTVARDVKQEQRIEQGLQNGSITTREAAALQRDESRVDHLQARALKDGKLTADESARLNAAQNQASRDIQTAEHNGVNANPLSGSSQRMQADVQRNVNQQKRIEAGVQNGSLTHREVARLERGQAHVDRREANAASDGHVSAREQQRLQRKEDRMSHRIHREKHNVQQQSQS